MSFVVTSRGSSGYRSISAARARPQQQTRRLPLLLSIDSTFGRKFDSGLSHILRHDRYWLDVPQPVIFKLHDCVCLHGLHRSTLPSCAFQHTTDNSILLFYGLNKCTDLLLIITYELPRLFLLGFVTSTTWLPTEWHHLYCE